MVATLCASGCRDALFDGERVGEQHIVRGGPVAELTPLELLNGRFVSTNEDLVPLQTLLRTRIKLLAQLGDLGAPVDHLQGFAQSEALSIYLPRSGLTSTGASGLSTPFADHLSDKFRTEYKVLCQDDVLGSVFPPHGPSSNPCDPLDPDLGGIGSLLDQLTLTSVPSRTAVRWFPPSDHFSEAPVADGFVAPQPTDAPGTCGGGCSSRFVCPPGGSSADACVFETTRLCTRSADCRLVDVDGNEGWGRCSPPRGVRRQCDFSYMRRIDSDFSGTAPVLGALVSFDVDTEVNPFAGGMLLSVGVTRADIELRIQPVSCPRGTGWGTCADRTGLVFAGGHGSSATSDLVRADIGLDVKVRGTHGRIDTTWSPGFTCLWLGPLCTVAGFVAVLEVRVEAAKSLARGAKNIASTLEQAIEVPSLAKAPGDLKPASIRQLCNAQIGEATCDVIDPPGSEDDDMNSATLDTFAAFAENLRVDLGSAHVRLRDAPPSAAPVALGAPGGAFSNRTIDALSRGADVVSLSIDLTSLGWVCGTSGTGLLDPTYLANCGDAAVPPNPSCSACRACALILASDPGSALCHFGSLAAFGSDASGAASLFTIQPSPTVAAIFDGALTAGTEIRDLFAQPLVEARVRTGESYRYASAQWCGAAAPTAGCLPRENGAVFTLDHDRDSDGVPDRGDNCPSIPNGCGSLAAA